MARQRLHGRLERRGRHRWLEGGGQRQSDAREGEHCSEVSCAVSAVLPLTTAQNVPKFDRDPWLPSIRTVRHVITVPPNGRWPMVAPGGGV
eukprot:7386121-Prymnesium_polylepis.2